MGPLHITGVEFFAINPIEINLIPFFTNGFNRFLSFISIMDTSLMSLINKILVYNLMIFFVFGICTQVMANPNAPQLAASPHILFAQMDDPALVMELKDE